MTRLRVLLALAGLPVAAIASQSTEIRQAGRDFSVREVHVARGDTLHFVNADEFAHQIYVRDPRFSFASEEQEPGQTVDLRFDASGTFEVRCEIHPKMKLAVTVD
jgi:plastocyanin